MSEGAIESRCRRSSRVCCRVKLVSTPSERESESGAPIRLVPVLVERVAYAGMVRGDPVGRGEYIGVFEERVNVAEDGHVAV